jgi:hypothetical protein
MDGGRRHGVSGRGDGERINDEGKGKREGEVCGEKGGVKAQRLVADVIE